MEKTTPLQNTHAWKCKMQLLTWNCFSTQSTWFIRLEAHYEYESQNSEDLLLAPSHIVIRVTIKKNPTNKNNYTLRSRANSKPSIKILGVITMWRWPQGLPIAGIYSKDRANMDSCILKIVFPKGCGKIEDPCVQIRPISSFHWIWRRPGVLLHPFCGIPQRADPRLPSCTSLPAGAYLGHTFIFLPACTRQEWFGWDTPQLQNNVGNGAARNGPPLTTWFGQGAP